MAFFYSYKVDRALSSLGVVSLIAELGTIKKLKTFGEKEDFWPKETAIFIYYTLPEDMKPQSSEAIIKLWLNQKLVRAHVLMSIKQMMSQNAPSLSTSSCNSLENLISVYSINVYDNSEKRTESIIISVARFITQESVKRSGRNIVGLNDDERFLAMLICLVASNHLTKITNLSFEILSAVACLDFDKHKGADFGELIANYNRMVNSPSESYALEAIGNQVLQFVSTGDSLYLDKLGELYSLLVSRIKS